MKTLKRHIKYPSRYTNVILLIVCTILIGLSGFAQTTGDFQTKATGEWESVSSWQTYDGTSWVDATTYPGQNAGTYAVKIQQGHTITISEAGITTQQMGNLTISGFLNLTGGQTEIINYSLNTPQILVTPNLIPDAAINFMNKADLIMGQNAIIIVSFTGLVGDCNNNQDIFLGTQKYAVCHGAPQSLLTFEELMAGGGTLNAILTAPTLSCFVSGSVSLQGSYSGTIYNPATYSWVGTKPGGGAITFSPNSTTNNVSFTPDVLGTYTVSLSVSTDYKGTIYTNTETQTIIVSTDATAIASGNWETPSIWSDNMVPTTCSNVTISNGIIVNLTSITNVLNVTNNGTLNINSAGTLNSTGTITNTSTGTLNLMGTINATSYNFSAIGNTVNYQSSTTNQTVIVTEYNNLGILNTDGHTASFPNSNDLTVTGNLTITGMLQSTTQNVYLGGNFINNGTFTHNTGEVVFNGGAAQGINGTTITTFADLTINNTSTGITLNNAVLVNGILTFIDGIVDATSNLLTFQANATVIGVSNASHVKGLVKKITSSTALFVFPIGDGSYYRGIAITNPSDNTWSAQYYNIGYDDEFNVCQTDIPKLHHVSNVEYWDIEPETEGGSTIMGLTWNDNSFILYPEFLLIAHWNSTNLYWENAGLVTIDEGNKTITSNNPITVFSPFTLGTSNNDGSLPIELVTIDARCGVDNCITITWTTSSEENNNFYTIYKSDNGINWTKITQIPGAGTSKTFKSYKYTDTTPIKYNSYYKLEQTDFNGHSEEFDVMCVFCQDVLKEISISPIPAKDFINLNFYNVTHTIDKLTIYIYNQYGQIVDIQYFESTLDDNSHKIILPENLIDGNYFLKVKFGNVDFYSAVFIKKSSTLKRTNYIADLIKLGF